MSGWIQLHRQLRDNWIYQNPLYLKAWITMLFEVNHTEKKVLIESELIVCGVGQSINSLSKWAELFGKEWTIQKVRTFFALLKKDSMIDIEGLRKTTRVTICKYAEYQKKQQTGNTENNRQPTDSQQTANRQPTTNNNYNNYNNGKNEKNEKECIGEFLQNSPPPAQLSIFDETAKEAQILNKTNTNDKTYQNENKIEIYAQNKAHGRIASDNSKQKTSNEGETHISDNGFAGLGSAKKNKRFIPPTVEQVTDYLRNEKNIGTSESIVIATKFVTFYGSKNWMVGKNKMTSWRMAAAGWVVREDGRNNNSKHYKQPVKSQSCEIPIPKVDWAEVERTGDFWGI